jgi:phosphonate transport system substrate-binding protein
VFRAFLGLFTGLASGVSLLFCVAAHGEQLRAQYTLAVVPYQLPLATHRDWQPIAERLSLRLGVPVRLRVYHTFASFEAELLQGAPDFAFVNPYHQVMAHRRHGYVPLVRSSNELRGILVVPRDSQIQSVAHLSGSAIVFPSPNAFAASLYMRALLVGHERVRFTTSYLDSHNDVYRHVIMGHAEAGGGTRVTLARESPEVQAKLRILYETPPTVSHPLSAHPRVSPATRDTVIAAILELNNSVSGRELLKNTQLQTPKAADYKRDYGPLERLHLEKYVVMPQ